MLHAIRYKKVIVPKITPGGSIVSPTKLFTRTTVMYLQLQLMFSVVTSKLITHIAVTFV